MIFQDDPARFLALLYVKTHVIQGMQPFNYLEDPGRRSFFNALGGDLPVDRLNTEGVSLHGRAIRTVACEESSVSRQRW